MATRRRLPDFDDETDAAIFINENVERAQIIFQAQAAASAAQALSAIDRLAAVGATEREIVDYLVTDFRQGGAIFRGMTEQFRSTVRDGGSFVSGIAAESTEQKISGISPQDRLMMWQSVLDRNTCPTCGQYHGRVESVADWEGKGPRETFTECGIRCRCELVPVDVVREDTNAKNQREVIADAKKDARAWEKQMKDKTGPIFRENRANTRANDQNIYYNRLSRELEKERRSAKDKWFKEDLKSI